MEYKNNNTGNKKLERSCFEPILVFLNLLGVAAIIYLAVLNLLSSPHVFRFIEIGLAIFATGVVIQVGLWHVQSNKTEKKELQENTELDSVEVDGVTYLLEKPKAFFRHAQMMGFVSISAHIGHLALVFWGGWLWFQKPNLVLWGNFAKLSPKALFVFSMASMVVGFLGALICLRHAFSRLTTRKRQIEWVSTAKTSEDARKKFFKKWNFWMGRKEKCEKQENKAVVIE